MQLENTRLSFFQNFFKMTYHLFFDHLFGKTEFWFYAFALKKSRRHCTDDDDDITSSSVTVPYHPALPSYMVIVAVIPILALALALASVTLKKINVT
jgi:hypothetical protein